MAVTKLEYGDRSFDVVPQGWYRLLSSKQRMTIPYSRVIRVEHDVGFANRSFSAESDPGVHIPILLKAGTYVTDRERSFWLRRKAANCITIQLRGDEYDYLCIEVDDPAGEVDRLRDAASLNQAASD